MSRLPARSAPDCARRSSCAAVRWSACCSSPSSCSPGRRAPADAARRGPLCSSALVERHGRRAHRRRHRPRLPDACASSTSRRRRSGVAGAFFTFGLVHVDDVPFPIALRARARASRPPAARLAGVVLLRFFSVEPPRPHRRARSSAAGLLVRLVATTSTELPFFPDAERAHRRSSGRRRHDSGRTCRSPGWEFHVGGLRPGVRLRRGRSPSSCRDRLPRSALAAVLPLHPRRRRRAGAGRERRAGVAARHRRRRAVVVVWAIAGSPVRREHDRSPACSTCRPRAGGFAPQLLLAAFAAAAIAQVRAAADRGRRRRRHRHRRRRAWSWSFPERRQPDLRRPLPRCSSASLLLASATVGRAEAGRRCRGRRSRSSGRSRRSSRAAPVVRARALGSRRRPGRARRARAVRVRRPASSTSLSVHRARRHRRRSRSSCSPAGPARSASASGRFAAVGAVVGGALTATLGLPFWFAVPLAAAVTGAFAVLVGIPALRIPGLFLLPVTFAFAVAVQATLFEERYFGWLLPDEPSSGRRCSSSTSATRRRMYFLCVACLVLVDRRRRQPAAQPHRPHAHRARGRTRPTCRRSACRCCARSCSRSPSPARSPGSPARCSSTSSRASSVESFVAYRAASRCSCMAVLGGVGSVAGALLGTACLRFITYFGVDGLLGPSSPNGGAADPRVRRAGRAHLARQRRPRLGAAGHRPAPPDRRAEPVRRLRPRRARATGSSRWPSRPTPPGSPPCRPTSASSCRPSSTAAATRPSTEAAASTATPRSLERGARSRRIAEDGTERRRHRADDESLDITTASSASSVERRGGSSRAPRDRLRRGALGELRRDFAALRRTPYGLTPLLVLGVDRVLPALRHARRSASPVRTSRGTSTSTSATSSAS